MTLRVIGGQDTTPAQAAPVLSVRLDRLDIAGAKVLGGIAFDVRPGETVALTGPSGIGKTTLLRAIAGLSGGFAGTIAAPPRIGMVFQEPTLLPWRSLRDNLCIAAHVDIAGAEAALEDVGLGGRGDLFPGQLSLGQQRRLSLARAFAGRPDLLLMDEPFVSLDPDLVDGMMRLFARLRAAQGVATILVTHVEREAELLASRIIRLGGTPAGIVASRQNKGAYFQLSASGVTSSRS